MFFGVTSIPNHCTKCLEVSVHVHVLKGKKAQHFLWLSPENRTSEVCEIVTWAVKWHPQQFVGSPSKIPCIPVFSLDKITKKFKLVARLPKTNFRSIRPWFEEFSQLYCQDTCEMEGKQNYKVSQDLQCWECIASFPSFENYPMWKISM